MGTLFFANVKLGLIIPPFLVKTENLWPPDFGIPSQLGVFSPPKRVPTPRNKNMCIYIYIHPRPPDFEWY